MTLALIVGACSAAGACLRFLVDRAVRARAGAESPLGIFAVNVLGCFVVGVVAGVAHRHRIDPAVVTAAGTGFCGGLTTWSTWACDSVLMLSRRRATAAAANVLGSLVAGMAAMWCGSALLSG